VFRNSILQRRPCVEFFQNTEDKTLRRYHQHMVTTLHAFDFDAAEKSFDFPSVLDLGHCIGERKQNGISHQRLWQLAEKKSAAPVHPVSCG
jgi:hypothetical protein